MLHVMYAAYSEAESELPFCQTCYSVSVASRTEILCLQMDFYVQYGREFVLLMLLLDFLLMDPLQEQ